jgi:hypothetical protein
MGTWTASFISQAQPCILLPSFPKASPQQSHGPTHSCLDGLLSPVLQLLLTHGLSLTKLVACCLARPVLCREHNPGLLRVGMHR